MSPAGEPLLTVRHAAGALDERDRQGVPRHAGCSATPSRSAGAVRVVGSVRPQDPDRGCGLGVSRRRRAHPPTARSPAAVRGALGRGGRLLGARSASTGPVRDAVPPDHLPAGNLDEALQLATRRHPRRCRACWSRTTSAEARWHPVVPLRVVAAPPCGETVVFTTAHKDATAWDAGQSFRGGAFAPEGAAADARVGPRRRRARRARIGADVIFLDRCCASDRSGRVCARAVRRRHPRRRDHDAGGGAGLRHLAAGYSARGRRVAAGGVPGAPSDAGCRTRAVGNRRAPASTVSASTRSWGVAGSACAFG